MMFFRLFFVSALCPIFLNAQHNADCAKAYKKVKESFYGMVESRRENSKMHFKIRFTNFFEKGKTYQEIEAFAKGNMFFYDSPEVSIYADDKQMFTAIHREKIIRWQLADLSFDGQQYLSDNYIKAKKDFESKMTLASCWQSPSGYYVASSTATQELRKKYGISTITDHFNQGSNHLLKQEIAYQENPNGIKRQLVEYIDLNYNYKGRISGTAFSRIFERKGKFVSKYKNYKLVKDEE